MNNGIIIWWNYVVFKVIWEYLIIIKMRIIECLNMCLYIYINIYVYGSIYRFLLGF